MTKEMYNIGIIGAGMIAEHHIESFNKTGKARITWLADLNAEVMGKLASKYNVAHQTADYNDILNDPEVDAVVICTPPKTHKMICADSIKAQKHVLIEKPTAMSLEEVDAMIEVHKQYPNVKVLDCSCRHSRLQPKYRKVKEIIGSGALGDIYFMHHNIVFRQFRPGIEYHPAAKWFMNKAIAGGGPLFDWGVYDLSFHLGILGDNVDLESVNVVKTMQGLDEYDPGDHIYDVEEHFFAHLNLDNGVKYYWERGTHANMEIPNETRVYGTRGGLRFGYCSWEGNEIEYYKLDSENKAQKEIVTIDTENQDDALELAQHFLAVIEGREEPALSLERARKHLGIIFECYKNAK